MSVSLKPSSSLGFNRPLTQTVKRQLFVTNHNPQPVAFKIKTTAPKFYCVRPNSGRIEPEETAEVIVLLQAMKEEPPAGTKCKDKFLVQSTIITPEKETLPLQELWNAADQTEESKVHQQKIKVLWLPPPGQELIEEDEPSSFIDNTRFDSVRQNGLGLPQEPQAPHERPFSPAAGEYAVPDEHETIPHPVAKDLHRDSNNSLTQALRPEPVVPQPPVTTAPAAPSGPTHAEDELRTQLSAAQNEINRLRKLLESIPEPGADEVGLRRRRGMSDKSETMTMVSDRSDDAATLVGDRYASQEGVSPQVVGALLFAMFVVTYVFF